MVKKTIQVPVDGELLSALDTLSRKQRKARSEVIRLACIRYLREIETKDLDRIYQEGYEKYPEDRGIAESLTAAAVEVMPPEKW